jgi:segregation and condensation protein A
MDSAVTFHLDSFEGPLDLLLSLVTANRVDIMDIPVAAILEQYLVVLDRILDENLENACDFVAMAARLVYIKTRMLLPRPEKDAEDPAAALTISLLEYKKIKESAPFFSARIQSGRESMTKAPEPVRAMRIEYHHTPADLSRAAANVAERARRKMPPSASAFDGIVGAEPAPVEEKIQRILDTLTRRGSVAVRTLYGAVRSRTELVAVFLALLELMSGGRVSVEDTPGGVIVFESEINDGRKEA